MIKRFDIQYVMIAKTGLPLDYLLIYSGQNWTSRAGDSRSCLIYTVNE